MALAGLLHVTCEPSHGDLRLGLFELMWMDIPCGRTYLTMWTWTIGHFLSNNHTATDPCYLAHFNNISPQLRKFPRTFFLLVPTLDWSKTSKGHLKTLGLWERPRETWLLLHSLGWCLMVGNETFIFGLPRVIKDCKWWICISINIHAQVEDFKEVPLERERDPIIVVQQKMVHMIIDGISDNCHALPYVDMKT